MNISLIRHGKTLGNMKRQYIGTTDEPLCDEGIQELLKLKEQGIYSPPEIVIASSMKRCIQTAEILFPSQPIVSCADLVETNFGDFESKTYEELKDNPAYQSFLESGGTKAFPNGESAQEMTKRVWASFCQWIKTMSDEGYNDISFVIHGGPIMAIMFSLMPQSNFYDWHCTNGRGWRFNIKGNQRFEKATIEKIS